MCLPCKHEERPDFRSPEPCKCQVGVVAWESRDGISRTSWLYLTEAPPQRIKQQQTGDGSSHQAHVHAKTCMHTQRKRRGGMEKYGDVD